MEQSFENLRSEVESIRQRQGDSKRSPRIPREIQQKALVFLKQGMSTRAICEGLKISKATFSYWRNRNGLSLKKGPGQFREVVLPSSDGSLRLRTGQGHHILGLTLSDVKTLIAEGLI